MGDTPGLAARLDYRVAVATDASGRVVRTLRGTVVPERMALRVDGWAMRLLDECLPPPPGFRRVRSRVEPADGDAIAFTIMDTIMPCN